MTFYFSKMHSLGNDFLVTDSIRQTLPITPDVIRALADRKTGVGFDQCLIVDATQEPDIDFFYRIYNADGTEVGQCGNGARCLLRFVHAKGLTQKHRIVIKTKTTHMTVAMTPTNDVAVTFNKPSFEPLDIPLSADTEKPLYSFPLDNGCVHLAHAVNVGNPHAVTLVSSLEAVAVETLGQRISEHVLFPEKANAGFMQRLDPHHIRLRVYERGVGETMACGSGAVAAVAIGRAFYGLRSPVRVSLSGGDLMVHFDGETGALRLEGPAHFVYDGTISADYLKNSIKL